MMPPRAPIAVISGHKNLMTTLMMHLILPATFVYLVKINAVIHAIHVNHLSYSDAVDKHMLQKTLWPLA